MVLIIIKIVIIGIFVLAGSAFKIWPKRAEIDPEALRGYRETDGMIEVSAGTSVLLLIIGSVLMVIYFPNELEFPSLLVITGLILYIIGLAIDYIGYRTFKALCEKYSGRENHE